MHHVAQTFTTTTFAFAARTASSTCAAVAGTGAGAVAARRNRHRGEKEQPEQTQHVSQKAGPRPPCQPGSGPMAIYAALRASCFAACCSSSLATRPVQPVWWLAPRPAPVSPWKYS